MRGRDAKTFYRPLLGLLLLGVPLRGLSQAAIQETPAQPDTSSLDTMAATLPLDPATLQALRQSIDARDYANVERLLLAAIDQAPHSAGAARLLAFTGSVYFLNQDYLHAAVAWKKSDAIAPLDPHLQFSLAMAYVRINRPDWARAQLETLAAKNPADALYPYWLGRLDYDAQHFEDAFAHFQHAIALNPGMARAYDSIGLCYYRNNLNDEAMASFKKAIDLDKGSAHPSPWPYLDLAITQQFLDQVANAETNLREAIRIDPDLAQAHFQLGTVFESLGRLDTAMLELQEAARLNAAYPEPHMAMARVYNQLGKKSEAQEQVKIYLRLHAHETP
jgi:tetratricopeptide (TPR) repeat protein